MPCDPINFSETWDEIVGYVGDDSDEKFTIDLSDTDDDNDY